MTLFKHYYYTLKIKDSLTFKLKHEKKKSYMEMDTKYIAITILFSSKCHDKRDEISKERSFYLNNVHYVTAVMTHKISPRALIGPFMQHT